MHLQPQKALVIATKGELGWRGKLVVEISEMLGGEKLSSNMVQNWKPFDAAMKTTGVARKALLRAFVSPKVAVDRFKWEQRTLDALAVFYADKYKEDERDSETRAQKICEEVDELFGEDILQPVAVQVSILDYCRYLAMSIHYSSQLTILQRRKKRLNATLTTRTQTPTQMPRVTRLRLQESGSERKISHRFLLLPRFLT